MVLIRDLCKVLRFCAIFLHMFDPGIAEQLGSDGTLGNAYTINDYEINKLNISHIISVCVSVVKTHLQYLP